ncbi:MAG: hypothetical protein ABIH11_03850 [Candidatus Altiarchaeota archaeon]
MATAIVVGESGILSAKELSGIRGSRTDLVFKPKISLKSVGE